MGLALDVAWIGLGGVVIGGLISGLTSWLVQLGERRKFRRERSWDLRREAYTGIIGSLDRARALLAYIDRGYEENPQGFDGSAHEQRASKQMIEQMQAARFAYHAQRLILSQAFVSRYETYLSDMDAVQEANLDPPEKAHQAATAIADAVVALETLAAAELGFDFK